jgi:hypothetical protein
MIFSRFPSINKLSIFSQQSKQLIEKYNNLRSWEIDKSEKIRDIMGEINICTLGS